MKDIAQLCIADLQSKIKALTEFSQKQWTIVDEDDLFNKATGLSFPCAGVVYEGMRSQTSAEGSGKSSVLTCSVYLLYKSGTIGNIDYKPKAVLLLDSLRNNILGKTSPSGHKWKFSFESPAEDMHKALVYYQRWTTDVIL